VGGFLQQAMPAIQMYPQSAGVLIELLQFALRGWKTGRTLEAKFEEAGDQLTEAKRQPQQAPPPDPKMVEAQSNMAIEAKRFEIDQMKAQAEMATAEKKAGLEMQIRQQELWLKQQEGLLKQRQMRGDMALKVAAHNQQVLQPPTDDGDAPEASPTAQDQLVTMVQQTQQLMAAMAQSQQALASALAAPKRVDIVRDAQGRATGGVQRVLQ
jgi:hypothetical protein